MNGNQPWLSDSRRTMAGIIVVNIDNKLDDQVMPDQGINVSFIGNECAGELLRFCESAFMSFDS